MSRNEESLRIGRERIARVFRYLQALDQRNNPVTRQVREQHWTLWFHDLPDHHSIHLGTRDIPSANNAVVHTDEGKTQQSANTDFILKVRRPTLTKVPSPPDVLSEWLEKGWDDCFRDVRTHASQNKKDTNGKTHVVKFEDDPERPKTLTKWLSLRNEWAQNEKPARAATRIFERFYELHGRLEREAENVELVLGDGILSWQRVEGGVYHPVLLQRVQLEFNPAIPEFSIVETEHEVELYSALFRAMPDVDGNVIARCREELTQGGYHPLGEDSTFAFLRSLVARLSARGEFVDHGKPPEDMENPCIGRAPVLFLRSRTLGFATAISDVLEEIPNQKDFPAALLNIMGVETPVKTTEEKNPQRAPWRELEDILLSKPANQEQIHIAERLERHGAVLVQGPPGTGKTHTIANLIGHLLAQGKSVLVTAATIKALRVLRDQVTEQLQPLCVSVLASDTKSQEQLESSVNLIIQRLSGSDMHQLEMAEQALAKRRKQLLAELSQARQELINAQTDEYRDIIIAGQSYTPSDAARKIAAEEGQHSWLPVPITRGVPLLLSEQEVRDLYRTNISLTSDDEHELSAELPQLSDLLSPDKFHSLIGERSCLNSSNLQFRNDLWDRSPDVQDAKELAAVISRMQKAIEQISWEKKWDLAIVDAGRRKGSYKAAWDSLLLMIERVCKEAERAHEDLIQHAPSPSSSLPLEEQKQICTEILQYLKNKDRLGYWTLLTRPAWKRFITTATVAGQEPQLLAHFQALCACIALQLARNDLRERWKRQVASLGDISIPSESDEEPIESIYHQLSESIRRLLEWYGKEWEPLEITLKQLGFRLLTFLAEQPPTLSSYGDLLRLKQATQGSFYKILTARLNAIRWLSIESQLKTLAKTLVLVAKDRTPSRVMKHLFNAVTSPNVEAYTNAFQRLGHLQQSREAFKQRQHLLAKLSRVAPAWATTISNRQGIHANGEPPGNVTKAWLWRQLQEELECRNKISLEVIQQKIEQLNSELRQITTDLIDQRAWRAQVRRTTLSQRQALRGWLDIVRKIGKGTGKRVPRLRAEANRKMKECKNAVPVWVMPLARVVENFDFRTTRFDVVIIDEASQSDVMALLAFAVARQVVIVGDHEQVSPSAVGQKLDEIDHLIAEHLTGIPNAVLYDGQTSVYDLARQSFGGVIPLLEHFRCVPEIIEFSNHLSYEGRIRPLRDPSLVQLKPAVISYRVESAIAEGKINREEAITTASLIAAAIEQPEYQDKTFGVISLVGEEQALEIEQLLLQHVSPEQYESHRILCGNAAHFQGDERDVMFLSFVDTSPGAPLPMRDRPMFKQRFNVAASRARDQMWVIHSLDPKTDLKPGDLRRRLIEYAQDPAEILRTIEETSSRVESEFERQVMARLVRAGYCVHPQWKVGAYRIDLVVEGGGRRLAIECDGDRYHPIEKLPEDMVRQATLERLGWKFVRIRGSQFFRDPDTAMQPVFEQLTRLAIPPERSESQAGDNVVQKGGELKERVIRRAYDLRQQSAEETRQRESSDSVISLVGDPASDRKPRSTVKVKDHQAQQGKVVEPTPPSVELVKESQRELFPPAESLPLVTDKKTPLTTSPTNRIQGMLTPSSPPKAGTEVDHLRGVKQANNRLQKRAREIRDARGKAEFTNEERKNIREALGKDSFSWPDKKLAEVYLQQQQTDLLTRKTG
jgi:very-short-patch-repair endonuclease/DNA polymerase III delta prime subunit